MKRKILSIFIIVALLLCAAPTAAAAGADYIVASAYANVLPEPDAAATPIATVPGGTVVTVQEIQNDFGRVTLRSNGVTGWIYMGLLEFRGDRNLNTDNIKNIYIKAMPAKTEYIEGEEAFDPAGLTVYAAYTDGKPDAQIRGCRLYLPDFNAYGEKTAQVFYTAPGGAVFSASFTLTVVKVPIDKMTLRSLPEKTDYIEGQALALEGLSALVTYKDGRPDRVFTAAEMLADPDFIITGCHNETEGAALRRGDHTVNVYYKYPEVNASFGVSAKQKTLLSLTVATNPNSLVTYSTKKAPELTGLTLAAEYDNGITETVYPEDCVVTCDPAAFVLGSGNIVTVSFGGKSIALDFTLALDTPVSMELITPQVLTFITGETIDLTTLRANLVYASGEKEAIKSYRLGKIDPTLTGPQTVSVTYGEFSELLTINISPYYQKGDVNNDARVRTDDARLCLRAAIGLIRYTGNAFRAADVDRDGMITTADARLILRASIGLDDLIDYTNLIKLSEGVIYEAS